MTTVVINSGACGFSTTITALQGRDGKITVTVDSPCEMVRRMGVDIVSLERATALAGYGANPVHASAARHLKHAACPVPSGVLKAVEIEAGTNVPRDASIRFVTDEKK